MFTFDSGDEEEAGVLDPDRLQEELTNAVGEDQWDDPRSIEVHRGFVLVRQTALNQARIRSVLGDLARSARRAVELEVGFYALPAALEDEVRAAALTNDGVLTPELLGRLDAAVAKGGDSKLVGAAVLTSLGGERVFLHQGGEQAYVSDYERSSGGTGMTVATVTDPIVSVLRTGVVVDVRPTIVDEGGDAASPTVALDVRFARARPLTLEKRDTPWGPLTTPQMTMDSVRTSARVPAGAGVLAFAARGTADDGTTDVVIVVRPRVVR
jgi:hypothetical protein